MFNVLWSICKDGVGTITDVEGNTNAAKYIYILDNNLFASRFQIRKLSVDFSKMTTPPIHQSVQTKLQKDSNDVDCLDWPSQSPDLNIIEILTCPPSFALLTNERVINSV